MEDLLTIVCDSVGDSAGGPLWVTFIIWEQDLKQPFKVGNKPPIHNTCGYYIA